jgi:glycosyltransferase involved in cell wall biosynthesis
MKIPMQDPATGGAVIPGGESTPPAVAAGDGPPLSIGLISTGWPPDAFPNGVTTYVAGVAEGLRALGHRVTILDTWLPSGDHGDDVVGLARPAGRRGLPRRAADWLWYRAAPRSWIELRGARALAARIGRAAAERGVEVLEMEEAFGLAGQVQRAVPIPLSIRLHGPWFLNGEALGEAGGGVYRARVAREGWAIRRALALTAPSRDVLERTRAYYGLPLEHAEVIPNPTRPVPAPARWRPGDCEPGTILFVGRFDRHKGADTIIEAFARVLRAIPDARLRFVGPDRGLIDDQGRRWDVESFVEDRLPGARASGRILLMGHVPHSDLDALRRQAAVTVVCSRYEVFGLAATEAMALGAPVVAARAGGLAEIIRDGVDALLHRPGDPDDLAARILEVMSDPARAAEMGARAAAHCEREFRPVAVAARIAASLRRARDRAAAPAGA